jgi:iron complex transport system ATP-binding protein
VVIAFRCASWHRRSARSAIASWSRSRTRRTGSSRILESGGRHRARALTHDPHTLLLDEPLSGLDLRAAFGLLATLRELLRAGKTLVLVTHRVEEIPPEIERVVLLRAGAVFADGPKNAVLRGEILSALYDTPVRVTSSAGFFQALPG